MQNNYILLSEKNKEIEEISWITKLQRIYCEVNLQTHSKQTSFETYASETADSILKLECMKLPSFYEDTRDYPRFKSNFQRQVLPGLKKPETADFLKSYLSKYPFDIIYYLMRCGNV